MDLESILCQTPIQYLDLQTNRIPTDGLFCRFRRLVTNAYVDPTAPEHSETCRDHPLFDAPPVVYKSGTYVYILATANGADSNRLEYRLARVVEESRGVETVYVNWVIRQDSIPSASPFRSNRRLLFTNSLAHVPYRDIVGTFLLFATEILFERSDMSVAKVRDAALVNLSEYPDVFHHEGGSIPAIIIDEKGRAIPALDKYGELNRKVTEEVLTRCVDPVDNSAKCEDWREEQSETRNKLFKLAKEVGGNLKTCDLYAGIAGASRGFHMVTSTSHLHPRIEMQCQSRDE